MFEAAIVPANSIITEKGDSATVDLRQCSNRVFLVMLEITQVVEQESFEFSLFGSTDGTTWGPKALLRFPQKFYRGESPMLLDLTGHPDVKFVRGHWEVNRWGRGTETPRFEVAVTLREVPAGMLAGQPKE